jgi:hypothetical protein
MEEIFKELIVRYGIKRSEFISSTWPKQSMWREFLKLSAAPKAEECIGKEIEFYNEFAAELDDIPRLRNKVVTLNEWGRIVDFLKLHNERLSSQIDNSTTLTATFVFLASIFLLMANYLGKINFVLFVLVAVMAFQIFLQRMEKRHELARNKEILLIIECYMKKI